MMQLVMSVRGTKAEPSRLVFVIDSGLRIREERCK